MRRFGTTEKIKKPNTPPPSDGAPHTKFSRIFAISFSALKIPPCETLIRLLRLTENPLIIFWVRSTGRQAHQHNSPKHHKNLLNLYKNRLLTYPKFSGSPIFAVSFLTTTYDHLLTTTFDHLGTSQQLNSNFVIT